MEPLLRMTVTLSRLTRRRWTRAEALVVLVVLAAAFAIVLIEWLGYWPDWMTAHRTRRVPMRP